MCVCVCVFFFSFRLRAAFRFCDLHQQDCIGREELSRTLTMFEHLYNGHRKKCSETQAFVDMIFEKFAKPADDHERDEATGGEPAKTGLRWEDFVRCALLHPLIVRFFCLNI